MAAKIQGSVPSIGRRIWIGVSTRHRKCLTIWRGSLISQAVLRTSLLVFLLAFSVLKVSADTVLRFPSKPLAELTPGSLCSKPDRVRYPEKIAYCERRVDPSLKEIIVKKYEQRGFNFGGISRGDYKIDHYFPLCLGGSNNENNLWPQHRKVFEITDPLEPLLCSKLSEGKIKQADAVKLIIKAKNDLKIIPEMLRYLNSL